MTCTGSRTGRIASLLSLLVVVSFGAAAQTTGPAVSLSPTSLSFGNQDVNFSSQPQSVTLTNTGSATLNITKLKIIGTNANSFTQSYDCGTSVLAGASCTISVTFTPSSTPGAKSASVQLTDNAPASPQLVPLSGTGIEPVITLSPAKVAFPAQLVGTTSAVETLTVKNGASGTDTLRISSISLTGNFQQTNTCASPVPVGSQCIISLTFTPAASGASSGVLTLTDNAAGKTQTVQLTGTGSAIIVSPLNLIFGSQVVGTASAPQTVTLSNQGTSSLTVTGVTTTGDFSESNSCIPSVGPGLSCTISIVFTPSVAGVRVGTLQINDSDPTSPQTVSLSGTATSPSAISLSATSLSFPTQLVGTTSKSQSVTLTNNGLGSISVTSVLATGDFVVSNGCGRSIAGGGQCTLMITFHPSAGGVRTGTVTITDSDPSSPQTVSLTGTGTYIKFSKAALTFPSVILVGNSSVAQSVTLTNTATTGISFSSIAPSGDFGQTNTCGTGISAGANCTVTVTFSPTNSGLRTGAITFIDTDPGTPQTVALSGTGTFVHITPASLSFGSLPVFTNSSTKTVTLSNTSGAAMTFAGILASGDFSDTNDCGTSLSGGLSCTISVTFSPTVAGSRTGSVTFNDTDATNIQTVALSGTGQSTTSSVTIAPRAFSLTPVQSVQFSANTNVTWSVDGFVGGNGTTTGTISATGLYSASAGPGSHLITATSTSNTSQTAVAQVFVTNFPGSFTWRYDNSRDGQNLQETVLNTANVNPNQFGLLASYPVDGQVYAQPLYVPNVNIPGKGAFNVVYVTTENDSVYAFDADGVATAPLWQTSFINPAAGITTVPASAVQSDSVMPVIGVTSTPVIDPSTGTLYVVPYTEENGIFIYRLHALDITTGAEKFGGPSLPIGASVPGNGSGSVNGIINFTAFKQNQRPALLLLNGVVYVAFASGHMDNDPYHGWVLGFGAQSLKLQAVYNATPDGYKGGVWQSGAGPAADSSGNIYVLTGNGTFDANTGGVDFGDSVLKITSSNLTLYDYFTPNNEAALSATDEDLSSSGAAVLPDQLGPFPHLLITGGKDGTLYLLNRDNMGQFQVGSDSQIPQSLPGILPGIFATPAYWQNNIYLAALGDVLVQFRLLNGQLSPGPISQTVVIYPYPGASPVVTSNGSNDGIVWTLLDTTNSGPAILRANDAANIAVEFYDSNQSGTRDQLDAGVKFAVPMVANGKVYVGTSAHLAIYGLLP